MKATDIHESGIPSVTATGSAVEEPTSPTDGTTSNDGRVRRGPPSPWAWRNVGIGFYLALGALIIMALLAIAAPFVSPHDPLAIDVQNRLGGPTGSHLLGTDAVGRDVLSRLIHGSRTAFLGMLIAVSVSALIGLPWGLVAGYLGGLPDMILMRLADAIMSFPAIVLAVGITGVLGPNLQNSMIAIGFVFAPSIARLFRSSVIPLRNAEFVLVARSIGASPFTIARRHILPNAFVPAFIQICAIASLALIIEASLSFLGLGVQAPRPSWGADLADAYLYFSRAPLGTVAPGVMITIAALMLTRVGDGLRVGLRAE